MRDYTIIIPSCTASNLEACLKSLKTYQPGWREKVIVYDNDSTGGVSTVCKDYRVGRLYDPDSRPFVFSRAVNTCMIPGKDVIVMNDDATLKTFGGFHNLHYEAFLHPGYGIISSSIVGFVGNPEQIHAGHTFIRLTNHHTIVFICVHISRPLIDKIGPLDERLIHYGWDDDLYCLQARAAEYKLGIFDDCIVEHGSLPSTYRTGKVLDLDLNRKIFESIVREKGLESHWPVPFKFPNQQEPD